MMTLARSVLSSECLGDECNIKESIWSTVQKCCINCLHKTLVDSNMQVQMAGLHALKTIVQLALAESPKNENYKLALIFMGELVTDVFSLIQNSTQRPVSNESAAVVSECLKLFVLLHSMIQVNEPQQDVLNLLLQAIIMSASVDTEDNSQAGSGLRSIAMKLVSHLANVPSFTAQFRVVLLGMPFDLRQKVQDIIRASVAQESNSSLATSLPVPLPAPKLVVQSLAANLEFSSQSDSFIPTSHLEKCDDNLETEEDDDWDNFQSFPASNLVISEETNGCETEEDASKEGNDFQVEKWDGFQSFSGSKLMTDSIELEGTVEDRQLNFPSGVSEGLTDMEQEPTLQKGDLQADALEKSSEADYFDGNSDAAEKNKEFDSVDAAKNKEDF